MWQFQDAFIPIGYAAAVCWMTRIIFYPVQIVPRKVCFNLLTVPRYFTGIYLSSQTKLLIYLPPNAQFQWNFLEIWSSPGTIWNWDMIFWSIIEWLFFLLSCERIGNHWYKFSSSVRTGEKIPFPHWNIEAQKLTKAQIEIDAANILNVSLFIMCAKAVPESWILKRQSLSRIMIN